MGQVEEWYRLDKFRPCDNIIRRQDMVVSEKERGQGVMFERIRRITGYITGDLRTWNSAKRQEEHDRVKHV